MLQLSEEWFRMRLGRITSTRMDTVINGTPFAWRRLLNQLQREIDEPDVVLAEVMEAENDQESKPYALRFGREMEPALIARYEIQRQKDWDRRVDVEQPAIIVHPTIPRIASSPDWRLPDRVGEGKSRLSKSEYEFSLIYGVPPEVKPQIYCHMWCAGVDLCDYVCYCPSYPDPTARLHIVEVYRETDYQENMENRVTEFLDYLESGNRPSQDLDDVPQFFSGGG